MRMLAFLYFLVCLAATAQSLPSQYYAWMESGVAATRERLARFPQPTLKLLESDDGGKHFPHAILPPVLLYRRAGDPAMLQLALHIGDLLATEDEARTYTNRLDHPWDTYMWLEAYRLLDAELGAERKRRWSAALQRNIALMDSECRSWRDFPRYSALYIGTSTNHFAQWAQSLYLGGKVFARAEWLELGQHILRRLATTEQSPEGFWGEYLPYAPTNGYSLLTLGAVGVYYEHSKDAQAREAMLRATRFHSHFTWPNGVAIETVNDRNREWGANLYGNFAFSLTPEGRALALRIARGQARHEITMEWIGRVAQNALYFHEGEVAAERTAFEYRMPTVPAAVGKQGPWMWCLSGITAPNLEHSQWFLDRQAAISVYHEKTGLIVIGANSKRQPELATFRETTTHQPIDGSLTSARELTLAYRSFFADVSVKPMNEHELEIEVRITARGPKPDQAYLTLQTPKPDASKWRIESATALKADWPVHPYSPYRNGPDTSEEAAIGTLTVPLALKDVRRPFVRPDEQVIRLRIVVP